MNDTNNLCTTNMAAILSCHLSLWQVLVCLHSPLSRSWRVSWLLWSTCFVALSQRWDFAILSVARPVSMVTKYPSGILQQSGMFFPTVTMATCGHFPLFFASSRFRPPVPNFTPCSLIVGKCEGLMPWFLCHCGKEPVCLEHLSCFSLWWELHGNCFSGSSLFFMKGN